MIGPAARKRRTKLKAAIQHYVEASIDAHAEPRHRTGLLADLDDRLDDPDFDASIDRVTVAEVVVRLCASLGVTPALRGWPDEMLLDVIGEELVLPPGWQDAGPADGDGAKFVVDPSGRRFVLDRAEPAKGQTRATRPIWSLTTVTETGAKDG